MTVVQRIVWAERTMLRHAQEAALCAIFGRYNAGPHGVLWYNDDKRKFEHHQLRALLAGVISKRLQARLAA